MRVTCPSCQTAYNIDERRIPPGGAKLKCSSCQTLIPLRPPETAAPPAPSVAGVRLREGAVPLPGLGLGAASSAPAAGLPHLSARVPEPPPSAQSLTTGVIPLPPRAPTPAGVPSLTAAPPVPPPRRGGSGQLHGSGSHE
ncbi:MAG TPA: zinc-ribbon domain-containing protein, partial [Myxococcaceae bacterium]|nr:zinc-ribbon domain-containing protein [Myxococcaceae bacterium]